MNALQGTNKWRNFILLTLPIWLPFVWHLAFWIELKFTLHGPFNQLAIFALFIAPAIGGLPILTAKVPVIGKLFVFPIYYFGALFIAGIEGWGLCMTFHTCQN